MKKRRELDALIGNRSKRDGGNERLSYDSLNSSLSSPTPDTYIPPSGSYFASTKRVTRTSGKACGCCTIRRMIRICLPVCFLTLVAACITACIGIVWMQVQLKVDVEKINNRIMKLESWQNDQPSTLNDMQKAMSEINLELNSMKSGENGITNIAAKLGKLTQRFDEQVKVPAKRLDKIQTETNELRSVITDLKTTVGELKSTCAELKTSQGLLTASFDVMQQKVDSIKTEMSEANVKQLTDIASSKLNTEEGIVKLNNTLQQVASNLTALEAKFTSLEDDHKDFEELLKGIGPITNELQKDVASLKQEKTQMTQSLANITKDVSGMKARIIEMTKTAETVNTAKKPPVARKPTEKSTIQRTISSQKAPPSSKSQTISLAQIVEDVANRFDTLNTNKNGKLTPDELTASYGKEASSALMRYDTDHDGFLSRVEVSNAFTALSTTGTNEHSQKGGTNR